MSVDPRQIKGFRILEELGVRALEDDEFRRELIEHPDDELRKAGLEVPEGVRVVVHENTDEEVHLVLPGCRPLEQEVDIVKLFCAFHWI